jgi:hypothetical protein
MAPSAMQNDGDVQETLGSWFGASTLSGALHVLPS